MKLKSKILLVTAFMVANLTDAFALSDMHDNFNEVVRQEIERAPSVVRHHYPSLPENITDDMLKRHFIATDRITVSHWGVDVKGRNISYVKEHIFPLPTSSESIMIARIADNLGVKALSTPRFCLKNRVPSTCDLIKFESKKDCYNHKSGPEMVPCALDVLERPKHGFPFPKKWTLYGLEEAAALTYIINPVGTYDYYETLFTFDKGDNFTFNVDDNNNNVAFYQQIHWRTELFTETNGFVGGSFQDYCIERFANLINRDSCDMDRFEHVLYSFALMQNEKISQIIDEVVQFDKIFFDYDSIERGELMKKRFLNTKNFLKKIFHLEDQVSLSQGDYNSSEL